MKTDDLDFTLPPDLIAQTPAPDRSASRLLHYRRADQCVEHRTFRELPLLLRKGDLLVFNNTRVLPARFMLRKKTGGLVEGLFLREVGQGRWRVLLKNLGSRHQTLTFADDSGRSVEVVGAGESGEYEISVTGDQSAAAVLMKIGRMPLPPYIKREKGHDARDDEDRARYQTIYADAAGAVAAPTAGLHFTPELLAELQQVGVEKTFVTLHVGLGTFKPVTAETLETHVMHTEPYSIDAAAADSLNRAKKEGRRIVAVGTTSARVLESQPAFPYPPYRWKHVSALITNFHLPRSTLIAMVASMVGLDEQRRIYRTAIDEKYRFFSYGDAMLID